MWFLDLLREALRRRVRLSSAWRFLRGQVLLRLRSLGDELSGALADLRELRRPTSDLLLVVHARRLQRGGFIEIGLTDLCDRLMAEAGAMPVRSRLGYLLRARGATRVFSVEPFTAAPPIRFAPHHASAVFVADTWDKAWMGRHLRRARPRTILTPYLWPVIEIDALRRSGSERWRLWPWWVPDDVVATRLPRAELFADVHVVGAAGPMYDLRTWAASHPLVDGFVRASGYESGSARLDSDGYFEMLAARSAIVVAFSEDEWMRVPVAKYVEVCAAGALLIGARAHHLDEMGFRDGQNCVIFEGREDLAGRLQRFRDNPDEFVAIAARGLDLIRSRHTTSQRLRVLSDLLGNATAA